MNTIELPVGNNVVPLLSDTIRLVQNGCSFHGLRSEDPNQHLQDFLKLVDSLDLDGSISIWEDLTTRFLAQFFPPGRTAKLRNDIMMFQQHQGESLSKAWTRFKDLLQKVPHHGIDRWLQIQFFYDHVSFHIKCEIDRVAGGKLCNKSTDESWEIIENLALYDHEGWNDSKSFEHTLTWPLKKVLIREEAKSPITKSVNSISLIREEEEKSDKYDVATGDGSKKTDGPNMEVLVKEAETKNGAENRAKNKPIKKAEKEEVVEAPSSQFVGYYLNHRINEKLIEGLVDNHRFNDSMSGVRVGKMKGKTYNLLPRGPVYEAILKKKITRKEDIRGNFEIPCNIGGLKRMNALVNQGSDMNIMPLSTYMKLTDERPAKTDIRLSLDSHSEDEKRPFILGTPFLTTAKTVIKFDKGTITLRSRKSKISFHKIHESLGKVEKGIKNDIEPIAPTMTVNRLVLEWEERIKLHQEKELEFDQ
ncbi:zinc finger, CCHC-type containing protein [Tanacetum coccineum]